VYRFDPSIFHGNNTEFNINEAEKMLLAMIKSPETINGWTLVILQCKKIVICHRKRVWTFICSHKLFMRTIKDSRFCPDAVGRLYVPVQHAKCTKSKGTAVKGKCDFQFFHQILCVISLIT
jgi:hypothetical protein